MSQKPNTALTITRHLPVPLDEYRKAALHNIAHVEFLEEERLLVHLKNVTDSIKGMAKIARKKQFDANHALHQGFEMQEVSREQRPDLERKRIVTYRLDTQEVVDERAMSTDEIKHYATKAREQDKT